MAKIPGPMFAVLPFKPLWMHARAGTLHAGDMAPDFALPSMNSGQKVRLSSLRGRPVVLIFGSYTGPPFRREVPALNKLYDQYKDRAAFLVVYIREAHPSDAWQMAINVRENVVLTDPQAFVERNNAAESCVRTLGIRIPALVDDRQDAVERSYTGWPDRLYVIDRNGDVAFKSAPGLYGFQPADVEQSLHRLIQ